MHDLKTPSGRGSTGKPDDVMSKDVLAHLGAGSVAYIRELKAQDLQSFFPGLPPIEGNQRLWALLNADGTPIIVADSREAAEANAFENELQMVSVH